MKALALSFLVCLLTGCADDVSVALKKEGATALRQVTDLAGEEEKLASVHEHQEREFGGMMPSGRLESFQQFRARESESIHAMLSIRIPTDHVFYVHSRTNPTTYYVLVRAGEVIARTEAKVMTE